MKMLTRMPPVHSIITNGNNTIYNVSFIFLLFGVNFNFEFSFAGRLVLAMTSSGLTLKVLWSISLIMGL